VVFAVLHHHHIIISVCGAASPSHPHHIIITPQRQLWVSDFREIQKP
jgi:hypothetical protein